MPALELNLENLSAVKGGRVALAFSKALNRMAVDLQNAPDIDAWRSVSLTIRAKPICEDGELSDVAIEFQIPHAKLPHRSTTLTAVVRSATNGAKQLFFAEDPEGNFDQTMIPMDGE